MCLFSTCNFFDSVPVSISLELIKLVGQINGVPTRVVNDVFTNTPHDFYGLLEVPPTESEKFILSVL